MRSLYRESESRPQAEIEKPKKAAVKSRRSCSATLRNAVLTVLAIMVIPLVAWDLRRKL